MSLIKMARPFLLAAAATLMLGGCFDGDDDEKAAASNTVMGTAQKQIADSTVETTQPVDYEATMFEAGDTTETTLPADLSI